MRTPWWPAYIAIGSNLDEPKARVLQAIESISTLADVLLQLRSRFYLTSPMGPQDQPHFVNAAVGVLTSLSARELLDQLLGIERDMGRNPQVRWGPRIIDLDLVWLVGPCIDEPGLSLPHPGVSARNFVLYPLADIAPALRIPGHGCVLDLMLRVGSDGISVLQS